MSEWWNLLDGPARIFWGVAIGASILQLLIFAGSLFGDHDFDHSTDHAGDGNVAEGVKLLSVRAIVAFFVGFGWAGALFLRDGKTLSLAITVAVIAGLVFMAVIFAMMRFLMSLRSDGTLDYRNAIGSTGQVYVTIPARRGGLGQVEILIQGRLTTVQAVTTHPDPLPPQKSVIVDAVEGNSLLVVSPAH